jgi:predicted NUDIX family phosphoesterase/dephospho-CoA kinase
MKAKLSVNVRRQGDRSPFVRTAPGKFFLRELVGPKEHVYYAQPLQPSAEKKKVLVFPVEALDQTGRFQGIISPGKKRYTDLLNYRVCQYMDRLDAEGDNSHKQIITYILVRRGDSLLAYRRGTFNRVEEYLRGSLCIGFGGHVSEQDLDLFSQTDLGVTQNVTRELGEELVLPAEDLLRLHSGEGLRLLGTLNDDSSQVGRRHFAFVYEYRVGSSIAWDKPLRGEKSITQLRWLKPGSGDFSLWDFEYWSQLCLRRFFSNSLKTQPSFSIRRKSRLKPPHLLLVLGQVGSGKSEATEILKASFGYKEINSGKILASLLKIPPVPDTPRHEFQSAAWSFINTPLGPKHLAEAIWDELARLDSDRILVDGIRQRSTIEELRLLSTRTKVGMLYVHTPPDVAYEFFRKRGRSSDVSIYDFLTIREALVESEVGNLIGISDAVLYNWTGRPQYRQVVMSLMKVLGTTRREETK